MKTYKVTYWETYAREYYVSAPDEESAKHALDDAIRAGKAAKPEIRVHSGYEVCDSDRDYVDVTAPDHSAEAEETEKETEKEDKKTVTISNIVWDTDDEDNDKPADLPTEVDIPDSIKEDEVADYLSDKYEYLVYSFSDERDDDTPSAPPEKEEKEPERYESEIRMQKKIRDVELKANYLMSFAGIKGTCDLSYREDHPKGANFSGAYSCVIKLDKTTLSSGFSYYPASMTADNFIDAVKADVFDHLAGIVRQTMFF